MKVLTIFTRQLATLIDAGLPLLRSLNTLAKQERNPVMRNTMKDLAESVEGGSTFSEALAQHPNIFNKLYVNMVKAGELGGVLEIVLTRLAEFQEKSQKIKGKVVSAMVYPIVVLVIAMGILSFLLVFIVPKFQQIFKDALPGQPLPAITEFVIWLSNLFISQWYLIIGAIAALVIGYRGLCRHRDRCRRARQDQAAHPGLRRPPQQDGHFALQPHARNTDQQRRADSPGA